MELRLSSRKPLSYQAITLQKGTWSARKTQTGWKWTKYLLQGCPRDDSFSFSYNHPKRDWEEYSNWNIRTRISTKSTVRRGGSNYSKHVEPSQQPAESIHGNNPAQPRHWNVHTVLTKKNRGEKNDLPPKTPKDLERTTGFFSPATRITHYNSCWFQTTWLQCLKTCTYLWLSPKAGQKTLFRFCYSFSPSHWKSSLLRVAEGCKDVTTSWLKHSKNMKLL